MEQEIQNQCSQLAGNFNSRCFVSKQITHGSAVSLNSKVFGPKDM